MTKKIKMSVVFLTLALTVVASGSAVFANNQKLDKDGKSLSNENTKVVNTENGKAVDVTKGILDNLNQEKMEMEKESQTVLSDDNQNQIELTEDEKKLLNEVLSQTDKNKDDNVSALNTNTTKGEVSVINVQDADK